MLWTILAKESQAGQNIGSRLRHAGLWLLPAASVPVSEDVARLAHALETALTERNANFYLTQLSALAFSVVDTRLSYFYSSLCLVLYGTFVLLIPSLLDSNHCLPI